MEDTSNRNYINIATGIVIIGTTLFIWTKFKNAKKKRICGVHYPKDTVILHQFERGKTAPSLGHFVMKLETYLRINKIPYESNYNFRNGPKGKVPWIEYNGITMGDSQLIIQFLNKEFNVDMDNHLTKFEKAQAWAIQKWIEEFMYWLNVHTRWVLFTDEMFKEGIPVFSKKWKTFLRKRAINLTFNVGVGRHSDTEIHEMMLHDLRQFSELLGKKTYLMGEKISVVDCSAFGILSQIRWCTPSESPGTKLLNSGEISNVVNYMDRIKDQYWSDWDSPKVKTNSG